MAVNNLCNLSTICADSGNGGVKANTCNDIGLQQLQLIKLPSETSDFMGISYTSHILSYILCVSEG